MYEYNLMMVDMLVKMLNWWLDKDVLELRNL